MLAVPPPRNETCLPGNVWVADRFIDAVFPPVAVFFPAGVFLPFAVRFALVPVVRVPVCVAFPVFVLVPVVCDVPLVPVRAPVFECVVVEGRLVFEG